MDFELELKRVAGVYAGQGFQVVVRPRPEDLPPFAKDFNVEILGKRAAEGVLVAVKRNREQMAADSDMPRYAEITSAQPGWRFDFVILEAEQPGAREARGAQELSGEDINRALVEANQMVGMELIRPAVITAWAAVESAMRMRLRAVGEEAGWGAMPRSMMNELYSSGVLSRDEFLRLERLYQVRNQIVHGFASPASDVGAVQFLSSLAQRLVDESRPVKQPA